MSFNRHEENIKELKLQLEQAKAADKSLTEKLNLKSDRTIRDEMRSTRIQISKLNSEIQQETKLASFDSLKASQPEQFQRWYLLYKTFERPEPIDTAFIARNKELDKDKSSGGDALLALDTIGQEQMNRKKVIDNMASTSFMQKKIDPKKLLPLCIENMRASLKIIDGELRQFPALGMSQGDANKIRKDYVEKNIDKLLEVLKDQKIYRNEKKAFAAITDQIEKQCETNDKDIFLKTIGDKVSKHEQAQIMQKQNTKSWLASVCELLRTHLNPKAKTINTDNNKAPEVAPTTNKPR